MIALVLAELIKYQQSINRERLILLCLYHDFPEASGRDSTNVNKKYVHVLDAKALEDIKAAYPLGKEICEYCLEFNEGKTIEAKLAHDADSLELMLVLKQLHEKGNARAMAWFDNCVKRFIQSEKLAEAIRTTPSDAWWFVNPDDPHWVDGGKRHL